MNEEAVELSLMRGVILARKALIQELADDDSAIGGLVARLFVTCSLIARGELDDAPPSDEERELLDYLVSELVNVSKEHILALREERA